MEEIGGEIRFWDFKRKKNMLNKFISIYGKEKWVDPFTLKNLPVRQITMSDNFLILQDFTVSFLSVLF